MRGRTGGYWRERTQSRPGPRRTGRRPDVDEQRVDRVLDEHDRAEVADAADAVDWDDPTRCSFCGAAPPDGGPGFVDHIAENEACELAFAQWRESVAGDFGGEWTG